MVRILRKLRALYMALGHLNAGHKYQIHMIPMKRAVENTQNMKSGTQVPNTLTTNGEKTLSKKAAEMKIFLANNPIPKEFLQ